MINRQVAKIEGEQLPPPHTPPKSPHHVTDSRILEIRLSSRLKNQFGCSIAIIAILKVHSQYFGVRH